MWALIVVGSILILFFTVFFGAPYVPAKMHDIKQAFEDLYELSYDDTVLDLGSGDGRVLREVSRRGGKAVGYEMHPILVAVSRWLSRKDANVKIVQGNFWKLPFPPDTTAVYLFGDGRDIKKMTKLIEREATRLIRPLQVVSYGFELPHHTPVKKSGAHLLYTIHPLQQPKA